MKSKIYPAIWFDNTARHAFDYYASLFHEVSIMDSNPVTVAAKVLGTDFIGINGWPAFRPNPAISFMIISIIYPAIWFDHTARHAFDYYAPLFHEVSIMDSNPVTVAAKVLGTDFIGINGGPALRPNPAISFMIVRETQAEIEKIWNGL